MARFPVNYPPPLKKAQKICHQNFTTFVTLQFTIGKGICRPEPTLGAISRNIPVDLPFKFKLGLYTLGCFYASFARPRSLQKAKTSNPKGLFGLLLFPTK